MSIPSGNVPNGRNGENRRASQNLHNAVKKAYRTTCARGNARANGGISGGTHRFLQSGTSNQDHGNSKHVCQTDCQFSTKFARVIPVPVQVNACDGGENVPRPGIRDAATIV